MTPKRSTNRATPAGPSYGPTCTSGCSVCWIKPNPTWSSPATALTTAFICRLTMTASKNLRMAFCGCTTRWLQAAPILFQAHLLPVVVVLPVLIVFMVLQRHFVRGIATTGLK